ncbi:hypothetical protein N8348_04235 [Litorivicinus sp.]|nr:hypothetical protein [Litorivicinus sp.]
MDNYFTGLESNHVDAVTYATAEPQQIWELKDFAPSYVCHLRKDARFEQGLEDLDTVLQFNKVGLLEVVKFCRPISAKLTYAESSTKFGDGEFGRSQSPDAWTKASNTESLRIAATGLTWIMSLAIFIMRRALVNYLRESTRP